MLLIGMLLRSLDSFELEQNFRISIEKTDRCRVRDMFFAQGNVSLHGLFRSILVFYLHCILLHSKYHLSLLDRIRMLYLVVLSW